ncbi:hypothetical protein E2320_006629 [Naja naja]|nr:hypothetical protein E2320_006629 [Naja naja]
MVAASFWIVYSPFSLSLSPAFLFFPPSLPLPPSLSPFRSHSMPLSPSRSFSLPLHPSLSISVSVLSPSLFLPLHPSPSMSLTPSLPLFLLLLPSLLSLHPVPLSLFLFPSPSPSFSLRAPVFPSLFLLSVSPSPFSPSLSVSLPLLPPPQKKSLSSLIGAEGEGAILVLVPQNQKLRFIFEIAASVHFRSLGEHLHSVGGNQGRVCNPWEENGIIKLLKQELHNLPVSEIPLFTLCKTVTYFGLSIPSTYSWKKEGEKKPQIMV